MKVEVRDLSSVKKILQVEIPNELVVRELDDTYKTLKRTATIKGFRPGKAPRAVLENYYRKDVHAEVTNKLLQDSFPDAVKETDLDLVGTPSIDTRDLDEKQPFTYEATVEIRPDIEDIEFKGMALTKNLYSVTDKDIDAQLNMIQRNLTTMEPIEEERPLQEEDVAQIDYEAFQDGQPFEAIQKAEKYAIKVGTGQITESFDEQLVGMSPGEDREITVTFPGDHSNSALADQEVSFRVTLHEIRKEIIPEINDSLAKKAGDYENLDALRETITDNLKQGYEKRAEQEMNEQIFSEIIDKTDFDLPEALIEYELDGIVAEAERSFTYRNISMEDMGLTREGLSERYRETAEKQVRRHLILDKLIKQEDLSLSDDALEEAYQEMAESLGQPVDEIKAIHRQNEDQLEYFKHSLLEKEVIRLIIDNGQITEVVPEEEPEAADPADTEASGATDTVETVDADEK